jgi:lysylphosphatidylglycerol synthetase-like protein (DUF2156 family)
MQILISVLSFLSVILFLAFAFALAKETRRKYIKRKISYEFMLLEKAVVLSLCGLVLILIPTERIETLVTSTFLFSILILLLIPVLFLLNKINRRAYVNVKRTIRNFFLSAGTKINGLSPLNRKLQGGGRVHRQI